MICRVCKTETEQFLDLGRQPIANAFIQSKLSDEFFYNLEVFFCPHCFTVQIGDCPDKERVFNDDYAFFTSTSNRMIEHFKKLADEIKRDFLGKDGFIVEIGSNDGTFLKNFKGYKHLGIEPSSSVNFSAQKKGLRTWNDFFNQGIAEAIVERKGQADVIVTTNCFPHMVDRHSVLQGIKRLLKTTGIWINEEAYLKRIMMMGSYDQFYNEHVFYSSVRSFNKSMYFFKLKLFDVKPQEVHGGSMRYYTGHEGAWMPSSKRIDYHRKEEGLDHISVFVDFADKVQRSRKALKFYLNNLKDEEVVGYGATAKSTTILNYCDIGTSLISRIYDNTPIKQGKLSPGKHIPIVPYYEFERDKPKHVVLFAWNHAEEIMDKEKGRDIHWISPI